MGLQVWLMTSKHTEPALHHPSKSQSQALGIQKNQVVPWRMKIEKPVEISSINKEVKR